MRRTTRTVRIGNIGIGGDNPVAVQTMAASKTADIDATVETVNRLHRAGAALVRVAVDTGKDAAALAAIRRQTTANLSVDLQENYRLAGKVAPHVDKIRYNPGHLHHSDADVSWRDKVRYIVQVAKDNGVALRIGVNCGSLDPKLVAKFRELVKAAREGIHPVDLELDPFAPVIESALEHCDLLDRLGFDQYCVSLKDSDPDNVILANRTFARMRPDVPLHLGVTEAGLPVYGVPKSRYALGTLLSEGIGETMRVSLTVPNARKEEEVKAAEAILSDVAAGCSFGDKPDLPMLNIVSCPSCARVQNSAFVALAEKVREATQFARNCPVKIAVMGCRVNGPGETDDADLGLWCGASRVNLKEGEKLVGSWSYEEIVDVLVGRLKAKIAGMGK